MRGFLANWRSSVVLVLALGACTPVCAFGGGEPQGAGCNVQIGPLFPSCNASITSIRRLADGESYELLGQADPHGEVALRAEACDGASAGHAFADGTGEFHFTVIVPHGSRRSFKLLSRDSAEDAAPLRCCGGALVGDDVVVDSIPPDPPGGLTWRPETAWGCRQLVAGVGEPRAQVRLFSDPQCTTSVPACGTDAAILVGYEGRWYAYTAEPEGPPPPSFYAALTDRSGNPSSCAGPAELEPGLDAGVNLDAGTLDAAIDEDAGNDAGAASADGG